MIISGVGYLGKQKIAFKGHSEEINSDIISVSQCNFIALLKIQAVNDPIFHEHHYSPMMHNTTCLHSDSRNKIINVLGKKIIQEDILSKIRKSKVSCSDG